MSNFDIIIKNGTIYDGSGNDSFVSDVFIKQAKLLKLVNAQIMIQQKI